MKVTPVTIELNFGYTAHDKKKKKDVVHKSVTFGKRLTGKEVFQIESDPQAKSDTQYNALLIRAAITKFGTLTMPVPLAVLLALDSCDWDDLNDGYVEFSQQSLKELANEVEEDDAEEGDKKPRVQLLENKVMLAIGYDRNGLTYHTVEFGNRTTVKDSIEADKYDYRGIQRKAFLAGKQITKFTARNTVSELDGPIGMEILERLDLIDLYAIIAGAEVWRNSFRIRAGITSANGNSTNGAAAG